MLRFIRAWVLVVALPAAAHASLITVEFSGTIDLQNGFSPDLVGKSLTGTYVFESTTPALPGTPLYLGAVRQITADFAGNSFIANGTGDLTVDDGAAGDFYFVGMAGTGTYNGSATDLGATLFAIDPTGALLSGSAIDTLPAIPPHTASATFQLLTGSQPVVGATITSVRLSTGANPAPIPEPVSMALLVAGGLVVGTAVRRRLD
jgi:hypothetical protein